MPSSSSSTDQSLIASWNNTSAAMNRYFSIIIFLFGTIGNVLNALVLSQGTLRRNSCSLYFLVSSLANLVAILSGLTTRMLSGWALDLTNTIDWLCKLRAFVLFLSRNIASWLILLAAIDRWLLSCVRVKYRQLSTFKNAQRGIILSSILSTLLYAPIFYCYAANLTNAPLRCYGKNDYCRWLNDMSYAGLTIIIPIAGMLVCGWMTIINIRAVKSRVHIISTMEVNNSRLPPVEVTASQTMHSKVSKRKVDSRLTFMLLIQIVLLALFTLPQAVQKIYSDAVANQVSTPLETAINNFVFNFVLLLTYFANGMPFYIYTLSGGAVFRNAFKHLIHNLIQKICCNHPY